VSGSDDNADARLRFLAFDLHNLERTVFPYALCFEADTIANTLGKILREKGGAKCGLSHTTTRFDAPQPSYQNGQA
jgi:hypothetical protein